MAVEAKSLAFLTNLASNPPNYPHNPTEPLNSQLTLYIVRVPGSRDVFLTPLKPRDKVVNAQDVQSSLYFLHIDEPEDARVLGSEDMASLSPSTRSDSPLQPQSPSRLARKPLPTPPITPEIEQTTAFPPLHPTSPFKHLQVPERKPVVPPRNPRRNEDDQASSRAKSPTTELIKYECASLTLIRRDPASGAQWNVAKIRDPPVEDVSSENRHNPELSMFKTKSSGAPLYMDILNPGYSKFLQYDQASISSRNSMSGSSMEDDQPAFAAERVFRRRMWLEGSRYADHSYGHRKSIASHMTLSSSAVAVDRRSKGYNFISPWGGKCEFSTGTSGRSLKVRRLAPSNYGVISRTDSSQCRHRQDALASHNETVTDVSELRFNLPTHAGRSGNVSVDVESDKRTSYFAPSTSGHGKSKSESFVDTEPHWTKMRNDDGKIDYSLGRERAGGGIGGKQAKLGKLIIEDEGQKMLDLVVAANLALWWRAYGRT